MPLIIDDNPRPNELVQSGGSTQPFSPVKSIRVQDPSYAGVVTDSRTMDLSNLATYVEGSPWAVEYFSQVITNDSELVGQQLSVDAPYTPYQRIHGFELRVTSALVTSQNSDTKEMQVQGSANVFSMLIVNQGDMFIADIGEGKEAVFRVTNTVKKSIFNASGYEIEYTLNTDSSTVAADLRNRAVKTLYFHREFLTFGENPLIIESKHNELISLNDSYQNLLTQYFKKFMSNEFKTLLVPGQINATYDPYFVKFLLRTFSTQDADVIRHIRSLNTQGDPLSDATCIWDALTNRSPLPLNEAFQKVGLTTSSYYSDDPVMNSIKYSGVSYVVYPYWEDYALDGYICVSGAPLLSLGLISSPLNLKASFATSVYDSKGLVEPASVLSPTTLGAIHAVTSDDYYVLSEFFYKKTIDQSLLEGMVWNFLRREPLDATRLLNLAQTVTQWGVLEQFYYTPIVLLMIRSILGN